MPIPSSIQKRARKSTAPTRPPIVPPPSTNSSIDRTTCHLCGYLGRTKSISIDKNGYQFLRYLPPASGALPVNQQTRYVQACHLCVLLLDKQRELNHTTNNFFFKGFFRSTGSCHVNTGVTPKSIANSVVTDDEEPSAGITLSTPSPRAVIPEVTSPARSIPPPLRRTSSSVPSANPSLDLPISDEISSHNSIRSSFLSNYTSLITSSSRTSSYDSCQLCQSIKPHGTLYSLEKSQFDFLPSMQTDVCTLCYYNLLDQYTNQMKTYRRPRPQCYLCHNRVHFPDWEVKLLETDYLPFLLNLPHAEQLYDNRRLALTCDQCFYTILFQYLDQERDNLPLDQRTYTWQCTYVHENERFFKDEHY